MNSPVKKIEAVDYRRIWSDFREQIRDNYSISQAVKDFTGARIEGRGNRLSACCPFHQERSPSFHMDDDRGVFRCYGMGCSVSGDIFELVKLSTGLGFKDAMLAAAERAGVPVPDAITNGANTSGRVTFERKRETERKELMPCDLQVVPSHFPQPQISRWFSVWSAGRVNRDGSIDIPAGAKKYKPEMVHNYRNVDGEHILSVLRCRKSDGGKFFIPVRVADLPDNAPRDRHGRGWLVRGATASHLRPVYGIHEAREKIRHGMTRLLVVEGEKCRDRLRALYGSTHAGENTLIVSPMGGTNSAEMSDWSGLARVLREFGTTIGEICVWTDADAPILNKRTNEMVDRQATFAHGVMRHVMRQMTNAGVDMSSTALRQIIPPQEVPSGWDAADAIEEGWDLERVLDHIDRSSIMLTASKIGFTQDSSIKDPGLEVPDSVDPFEEQPEDPAAFEEIFNGEQDMPEIDDMAEQLPEMDYDVSGFGVAAPQASISSSNDLIDDFDDGNDDGTNEPVRKVTRGNPHFRCLGYLARENYFMSLASSEIHKISAASMKANTLLSLAPREWWSEKFPKRFTDAGVQIDVSWEEAISAVIQASYRSGVWMPEREASHGCRIDRNRIVFNSGKSLTIVGQGRVSLQDLKDSEYQYTISAPYREPDIETAFEAGDPDIQTLIEIIRQVDWQRGTREMSVLALFGWICIAPICGVLDFRPHVWLDGPRGSGKSWILKNIASRILGQYRIYVKANTTEPGLRREMNFRAIPLIFDEAEGGNAKNKIRMEEVIALARHSSVDDDSVVAQAGPGGQGSVGYCAKSTFLMSSIVPQVSGTADISRFCMLHLAEGRDYEDFTNRIEDPVMDLLTEQFSDRFIGRMINRAGDFKAVNRIMVRMLAKSGLERRLADVYGTFATGAWLMMRDGKPAGIDEAKEFLSSEFKIRNQIYEANEEIMEDKDHNRLFNHIMAHEVRMDSQNGGPRMVKIGTLTQIACGFEVEDDLQISLTDARKVLNGFGMRPGVVPVDENGMPIQSNDPVTGSAAAVKALVADANQTANCILLHKKSQPIATILAQTPYADSYPAVMQQGKGVCKGSETHRFTGLQTDRALVVPLNYFGM